MTPALEPLYTLAVAVQLIPFTSTRYLREWLYRHRDEFPRRYQIIGFRRARLLSLSECQRIRAYVVKEFPLSPQRVASPRHLKSRRAKNS